MLKFMDDCLTAENLGVSPTFNQLQPLGNDSNQSYWRFDIEEDV